MSLTAKVAACVVLLVGFVLLVVLAFGAQHASDSIVFVWITLYIVCALVVIVFADFIMGSLRHGLRAWHDIRHDERRI